MLIHNKDALVFLETIENKSIDLILTDPPYIISKDSGMNKHHAIVAKHKEDNINVKTASFSSYVFGSLFLIDAYGSIFNNVNLEDSLYFPNFSTEQLL